MTELVQFLSTNWNGLTAAPGAFLLLVVLAFGAAFVAARWRYEGVADQLRERIEALKERLAAKDDQLDDYRQRLHLVPTDATTFSKLSNKELQTRALEVVSRIRAFLAERQSRTYSIVLNRGSSRRELTDAQRQAEWERETQQLMRDSLDTSTGYDVKFKVDSILLRDELLSRLPSSAKNEREYRTYEHPTNPIGMGMVADDLERLAKSLPVSSTSRGV